MFKKLSRLFVILTIVLSLSLSLVACNDEESGDGALSEFVPFQYTDGVHDFTNYDSPDLWLVKDGKTEYSILMPAVQNDYIKKAKEEFALLFNDATGINLNVVIDDGSITAESGKYISLGDTALYTERVNVNEDEPGYDPAKHITDAEHDRDTLYLEGVRIITKGDDVFILGGTSDISVINGVYDFMQLHFNFEAYYRSCQVIDKGVTNEKLKIFNVKDIPDIDRRVSNVPHKSQPRNYDLNTGLEAADIRNFAQRMRTTAGHGTDMLSVLYMEGWEHANGGYIHNVQEYCPTETNMNSTMYVNYDKYFYDEYIPEGKIRNADNTGHYYEEYAPGMGRLGDRVDLINNFSGDPIPDGLPDNWVWDDNDKYYAEDMGTLAELFLDSSNAPGTMGDWWTGVSICYTGRGNINSFVGLAKRVSDVVIQALRKYPIAEAPLRNTMLFSMEDAGAPCQCDGCKKIQNKYNSPCAPINVLLNFAMRQYIRPWMELPENEAYYRPELSLGYFVYAGLNRCPAISEESTQQDKQLYNDYVVCDKNVGVYIAGFFMKHSDVNDYVQRKNKQFLYDWKAMTDNIWIWGYTNYPSGAIYFNDATSNFNSDYYQILASLGVKFMFNEMQDIGDEACCWQNFVYYYQAKLMWDSTLDLGTLFNNYFDNMYLEASDIMKEIYLQMVVHRQFFTDYYELRDKELSGGALANSKYWPLAVMNSWADMFDEALAAISKYETINNDLYLALKDRIELEKLTPAFIAVQLYRDQLAAADFEEYKKLLQDVTTRYPELHWQGAYTSLIKTIADAL